MGCKYFLTVSQHNVKRDQKNSKGDVYTHCRVDFSAGKKIPKPEYMFTIEEVIELSMNTEWSLHLLRLKPVNEKNMPLPKSLELIQTSTNIENIVAIGYPRRIPLHHHKPILTYAALGSPWKIGNKRMAPGHLRAISQKLWKHDCMICRGGEGSPLIIPNTGQVVGIHLQSVRNNRGVANRLVAGELKPWLGMDY